MGRDKPINIKLKC